MEWSEEVRALIRFRERERERWREGEEDLGFCRWISGEDDGVTCVRVGIGRLSPLSVSLMLCTKKMRL